jgi:hypothetical protein
MTLIRLATPSPGNQGEGRGEGALNEARSLSPFCNEPRRITRWWLTARLIFPQPAELAMFRPTCRFPRAGFGSWAMLKVAVVWLLALVAVLPTTLLAGSEADWKPETEESALRFLEESRQAAGEMCRFDFECLRIVVDQAFGTERRTCLTVYSEESVGYRIEIRPVAKSWLNMRHTEERRTDAVSTHQSETWILAEGMLTVIDDDDRIYETVKITREDLERGWINLPHLHMPPWFDPTIESSRLRSLYRVECARSTRDDFFIELVLRKPLAPPQQLPFWGLVSG